MWPAEVTSVFILIPGLLYVWGAALLPRSFLITCAPITGLSVSVLSSGRIAVSVSYVGCPVTSALVATCPLLPSGRGIPGPWTAFPWAVWKRK
jgi:hypothetical protein